MTIQYDPGTDKALEQISSALGNILQPYKAQEQYLRAAISKDPSLAQKLGDLAATNPGSIAAFAGPNAEKFFSSINPSTGAKTDIAERPVVDQALRNPDTIGYIASKDITGAGPGAVKNDKVTGQIADLTGEALASNPDLAGNAAAKRGTGALAGTGAKQAQEARYLASYPQIQQLQQEGALLPEFDKYLNGQPSRFNADMLNAALDSPLGKTLLVPYLEQQKNARAAEIANSRFKLGDKTQQNNLDKLIVQQALSVKAKTGQRTTVGDIIYMMSGRQDLADAYGGTTPEGLVAAQQAFDENGDLKSKALRATQTITNITTQLKKGDLPLPVKQILVNQLNQAGLELQTPVQYTLDDKDQLVQIGGDVTPTTKKDSNPPAIPKPSTGPTTSSTSTSSSASGGASVKKSAGAKASTYNPPDYVVKMATAVKNMSAADLKKSPTFQKLDPQAQAYLLDKAKK